MKCVLWFMFLAVLAMIMTAMQGCDDQIDEPVAVDNGDNVTRTTAAFLASTTSTTTGSMMRADDFAFYSLGTVPGAEGLSRSDNRVLGKEEYHQKLKGLDVEKLYQSIVLLMNDSKDWWPADGPQDGDKASYAGLFGRLAWHCAGTFRLVNDTQAAGGCEGAQQRFWPQSEWRDNVNLDKARGVLAEVKEEFGDNISWSDLITFAGTVGIRASGGPAKKFCFGRVDFSDGSRSIPLGVEGVESCKGESNCSSDFECKTNFRWPEQNETDPARCNLTQESGRLQASHSVGLIYVYPDGPMLKNTEPGYKSQQAHNRYPALSAQEVRDTFKNRMGWTDRETVALIGGGHTLGRTHGNCNLKGSKWDVKPPYNEVGPYFEAVPGSHRGPTDGTCGKGALAGLGPNTVSSGFEGPWTRTPSQWNYDFFHALVEEEWEPTKSPFGADQWRTTNRSSIYAHTMRLTSDLALMNDVTYREIAMAYANDHAAFDSDFADAWYKLVHRSADHPNEDDLERESGMCTLFEFLN
eukprot:TRINITY_DN384_c0_g1_i5.p1 TRINITY_DN384_c0_g1~~TRINITY_DN384_c0_g1_i5.p1  ORF type:complete len:523 (+),score=97.83 TRINITY_DN384_c0_g1_i5:63-1631(+)